MRYFYSAIQKLIEFGYKRCDEGCRIYMFHQVNDDRTQWQNPNVSISVQGFKKFIDSIIQNGERIYSVEQLEVVREGACITFDDVYADACEYAIPYLVKKQIPFCIFVTLDNVGKEGFISESQLQWLKDEPLCTMGFHTNKHRMMRTLEQNEIIRELDQAGLEKLIGKRCEVFAFPYGSLWACTRKSVQKVAHMNYKMAFSTIAIPCTDYWWGKHRFFLPRINVNEENYAKKV